MERGGEKGEDRSEEENNQWQGRREYHFILRILPMNYKEEEGRVRGKRSGGDGAKGEGGAFYPTSLHSPVLCYHPG